MAGPLVGVRIVDLCQDIGGSVTGMLLADLGAEVVRPETAGGEHRRGDPRLDPGPVCWDRGKHHVVVDDLDPRFDHQLAALLSTADVVLVDGGPHAVAEAGWDPAALEQAYPELVVTWLPTMGARGVLADLPADPLLLSAISGYAQHQVSIEPVPIAPVVPIAGYVQGAIGAAAVVAALLERRRSGRGQVVTISGLHAVSMLELPVMLEALDYPAVPRGRDPRSMPAYRLYRCGDGEWLFLGTLVGALFLKALTALDLLELMVLPGVDGEFTNLMQPAIGLPVAERLEERFGQQPRHHWLALLTAADVPVAPVWSRSEWLASEALAAVGGRVSREHPDVGTVVLPAAALALSVTAPVVGALGERALISEVVARWTPRSTIGDGSTHTNGPLAGLKVIDLATYLAGPLAPTMMAQWGADVVKVEPLAGDPYRVYSLAYVAANQAKRSVAIDLRQAEGRRLLLDLVAQADVLVENLRGDSLARLGLTDEALHAVNPQLVHCSVTAFGPHGPLAGTPGFDPLLQARSGLMHTVGGPGHPVSTGTPIHDVGTASLTALGALAALWALPATGTGQRIDVALASSTLLLQSAEYTEFVGRPEPARGGVDFLGASAGHRYYQVADGWLAVAAPTPEQAEVALRLLERGGAVQSLVADLLAAGVPAARVVPTEHCLDDDHLVANDFSHVVVDEQLGRCRVMRRFADWSRSQVCEAEHAPAMSADSAEVLAEIGWDVEAARAAGIVL